MEAHLLLGDAKGVLHLIKTDSPYYLPALAQAGSLPDLRQAFRTLPPPESADILEPVAWAIIKKSARHPSLLLRFAGHTIGAFAQDPFGVDLIHAALVDPNRALRRQAADLAVALQDNKLKERVAEQLQRERAPEVRVSLIRAAASFDLPLNIRFATSQEQIAALEGLVGLHREVSQEQINTFSKSEWRLHRILACRLAVGFNKQCPILTDADPEVQAHAIIARQLLGQSIPSINAKSELTDMAWRWANGDLGEPKGAGGPLMAAMRKGERALESSDRFVQLTGALHLLRERQQVEKSLDVVKRALASDMRLQLKVLAPWGSKFLHVVRGRDDAMDHQARLHLIQTLLLFEDPQALALLEPYLVRWSWSEAVAALSLFLQEGSVEPVIELLEHPNVRVQMRAALVLTHAELIPADRLIVLYPAADRFHKLAILEVLGRTRSNVALSFLRERMLEEPFASLRLVAAGALLECLN